MQVIKRDDSVVAYDGGRIFNAVCKARDSVSRNISDDDIRQVVKSVEEAIGERDHISVEEKIFR